MSSSCSDSIDKKLEEGGPQLATLYPVSSVLPTVDEKDEDEAAKVVGFERNPYTEEEARAVRRKVDRRVIPILAAVYFSQFFDKNSLTYSSVLQLPIKGEHYNLVSMAFYLGFLVFEIPTSAIAQRFPLAKYLGVNMALWATFLILHAASATFGFFFAMRFLLGVCECCVSPILIAMISAWYPKHEQARRISVFYCMNGFAGMLGGLLAWATTFYTGKAVAHWRIFYFLMGGLAFIVAACVLLFLPDSPATAAFLTEREKVVVLERVRDNQTGTRNKQWKRYQAKEAVLDPKTWLLLLLTALSSVPNGGLATFSSILIKGFGFTTRQTLLLQIPNGAIAVVTTIGVCYLADRYAMRMLPILIAVIPTIVGAALMVGMPHNKAASMVGILLAQTYGSSLALLYAWTTTNTGSSTKKSTVNAMFMVTFGFANIVGTQIFQAKDAPQYTPGKIVVLALFSFMLPTVFAMRWYTSYLNKQKARKLAALVEEKGWTEEDVRREAAKAAVLDLTDRENPFHSYIS